MEPRACLIVRIGVAQGCMDNESFGGRSDVIKRITGYKRQGRPANIMKDNAFFRVYNARGLDNIFVPSFQSGYPDQV